MLDMGTPWVHFYFPPLPRGHGCANSGRYLRDRRPRYTSRHAAPCPPSERPLPPDEPSTRLDYHVVSSGGLEVGGFHRIGNGPSKGRWSWDAKLCTDDMTYTAGGYAAYPDVCCTLIGRHAVIGALASAPQQDVRGARARRAARRQGRGAALRPLRGRYRRAHDRRALRCGGAAGRPAGGGGGLRQRTSSARSASRAERAPPLARRVRKAFSLPGCRRSPRTAPALPPAPSRRAAPGRKSRCASRAAPGVRPRPGRAPWRHASRSAPP